MLRSRWIYCSCLMIESCNTHPQWIQMILTKLKWLHKINIDFLWTNEHLVATTCQRFG